MSCQIKYLQKIINDLDKDNKKIDDQESYTGRTKKIIPKTKKIASYNNTKTDILDQAKKIIGIQPITWEHINKYIKLGIHLYFFFCSH